MLVLQFSRVVPCLRGLYWWSRFLPWLSLVCMPLLAQASLDECSDGQQAALGCGTVCLPTVVTVSLECHGGFANPADTVSLCMCMYMYVHHLALNISFTKQQHTPCCRDQLGGCTVDVLVHEVRSFDCCMARVPKERHAWWRMLMRKHACHKAVPAGDTGSRGCLKRLGRLSLALPIFPLLICRGPALLGNQPQHCPVLVSAGMLLRRHIGWALSLLSGLICVL